MAAAGNSGGLASRIDRNRAMAIADARHIDDTDGSVFEATAGDYIALLKPRVMSLVVFTAFVGLAIAPEWPNPFIAVISILAIAVGAGASGALNMWYDADIDRVMARTAGRPIPAGRMGATDALAFGLVLSVFSVVTLGLVANWLAAAMLAFTIFFYAVVYTMWLKRSTPQNIVIGGAAGAFPPMIGWTAATGTIGLESVILFLVIFLWTPPHFWALALFSQTDYGKAGIPMLPNVSGEAATRRQIFAYALLVAVAGVLPWALGFSSIVYGAAASVLGIGFVWYAYRVLTTVDTRPARALFGYSLLYLFAVFALVLADSIVLRSIA